jgi:hypothetical protein
MHESPLKLGNREMNNGTVWLNLKGAGKWPDYGIFSL